MSLNSASRIFPILILIILSHSLNLNASSSEDYNYDDDTDRDSSLSLDIPKYQTKAFSNESSFSSINLRRKFKKRTDGPFTAYISEGGNVELTCFIINQKNLDNSRHKLGWIIRNQLYDISEDLNFPSFSATLDDDDEMILSISNAQFEHSGSYSCVIYELQSPNETEIRPDILIRVKNDIQLKVRPTTLYFTPLVILGIETLVLLIGMGLYEWATRNKETDGDENSDDEDEGDENGVKNLSFKSKST